MTIKSAGCAIVDDIVSSGSFLRNQVSACDYGILDNVSGCAVIVQPANSTFERIGYGAGYEQFWGITVEGYVRERGDPVETLTAVWDIQDALVSAINGGTECNTTPYMTQVQSIIYTAGVSWVSPGGNDFALVTFNVETREDP